MFISFVTTHILEIIGFVFGIIYVIGAVMEKWWCWPAGLLTIIAYGISTYQLALYGEFSLQFVYFFITVYGWQQWQFSKNEALAVSKSSLSSLYIIIGIALLCTVLFYYLLSYLNGSNPFWDSLTNGFAIVATYLVAKKKIENWLFWIPIDIVLSCLMFYRGMPFWGSLYIAYTLFAIWGYFQWRTKLVVDGKA